ncbi:histidine protein methyltransferase 1 homolog [Narcine bancroftii]|uniref:histidine protein methyltransferase 1 homolog n=1 Tax=Narcine bancroftii TaxID=1343680 RepID=UPI0038321243
MEFKFAFPLGSGVEGDPEPRLPEAGGSGGREPSAAQRRLREHVVGDLGEMRLLLERRTVSVLEVGGRRIKHLEPSALWARGDGLCLAPDDEGARAGPEEGTSELEEKEPGGERSGSKQGRFSWNLLSHSDLVPGLYEGGLTIWECTVDLVEYLANVDLQGLKVLDLGCGAGLSGITALGKGAACVHFQDYNSEVLEQLTIPNVFLWQAELGQLLPGTNPRADVEEGDEPPEKYHRHESSPLSCCRFFSGPWSLFAQVHSDSDSPFKYDVILSSETLYNPHSYAALHHALSSLLSDRGIVYLATKAHYFGVGGGIHLFQKFVEEKQIFDFRTLKVIDDGLQRCIALMSFRRGKSS